jgi:ATP phosphoribosyltransferase regulatory subunit HisZ
MRLRPFFARLHISALTQIKLMSGLSENADLHEGVSAEVVDAIAHRQAPSLAAHDEAVVCDFSVSGHS